MKNLLIGFGLLLVVIALSACGVEETVTTDLEEDKGEVVKPESDKKETPKEKAIKVDFKENVAGLEIKVDRVVFVDDSAAIRLSVKNTGNEPVEGFFPDQGNIQMGNVQMDALPDLEGHLPDSGRIEPGAEFEAPIVYQMPGGKDIDPSDVKEIDVYMGEIYTKDYMKTDKLDFTIKMREGK